ncbi:DUF1566 domain-containing protein [bacterium]|nr:DUF1566 domain-containing protein [bacterium]
MKRILVFAAALFATLMVFAQASKNVQDQQACDYARKKGTVEVWQDYLIQFPQGMCSFEAKSEIKDLNKKPKNKELQWSNKAPRGMNLNEAINYCKNLTEDGHSDWRLPNIDELRTLIKNCPKSETGGQCKVSERSGCLSLSCWEPEGSCYCKDGGAYSKLGDTGWFKSSSTLSDISTHSWNVNFEYGLVSYGYKTNSAIVRCVR